ncbi:hypothetical protein [Cellulosimicrobium arenosum]|uniref:Uncharacterized protein n=1 Tax=Cellulosimicrobium arenosum TaxID=2708133 RepID=A0A927G951_9MICO|nr:hypothetical protein [Cellulosimicrobium arenosum]MBD8079228.1 hypothetical protein [Cellulosimicrobium arenosum]
MTLRAVVLPGTPLLVPGAAGAADVLRGRREAALRAVRDLVADATRVVVLAAGTVGAGGANGGGAAGPARASLADAGIADARLGAGWRPEPVEGHETWRVAGPGASVALLVIAAARRTARAPARSGPTRLDGGVQGEPADVLEVDGASDPDLRALGGRLREEGASLVVADDPRSEAVQAVLDAFLDPAWHLTSTGPGTGTGTGGEPGEVREYRELSHQDHQDHQDHGDRRGEVHRSGEQAAARDAAPR